MSVKWAYLPELYIPAYWFGGDCLGTISSFSGQVFEPRMSRRIRINWPLVIFLGLFFLLLGLYIAWPLLTGTVDPEIEQGFSFEPSPADRVRQRAMAATAGIWFFVFGATIGSFLNVVAYRMPMRLSFVAKPSRCQYCETPILFRHNVPILGWLILRGRCHACRLPISPRYLMVEVLVGVLYSGLFAVELAAGGRNLPIREPNARMGVMWNLFTPQWDLIGSFAFHAFLLGTLATIALIKYDRIKLPPRLVLFALALAAIVRLIWPGICVLPLPGIVAAWNLPITIPVQRFVFDLLFGLAFGAAVEVALYLGRHRNTVSGCGAIPIFLLVASYLGWQACIPTLILGGLLQLALACSALGWGIPVSRWWAMSLLIGTWLTLCMWRHLPVVWLPGAESSTGYQWAGFVLGLGIVAVTQSMSIGEVEQETTASSDMLHLGSQSSP